MRRREELNFFFVRLEADGLTADDLLTSVLNIAIRVRFFFDFFFQEFSHTSESHSIN